MEDFRTEIIPEPTSPEERRSGFMRFMIDVIETLILSVLLFAGINAVSARIRVDGYSMEPSLHSGEFVIVNKLAYKFSSPKLGDVVVFRYPRDPHQEYIKRVIGAPGDRVRVSGGKLYVNNELIDEPYISAPPAYEIEERIVPEDTLFVLGDNRNNSSDSHNWGPVPMDLVIGKALFVYWPPEQWGLISTPGAVNAAQ